eukprot:CAMPEP_0170606400 /NCGR_PEP_ID=MMETSP0224-20130122/20493_1 /TAXON_ID=285029 /ORGANISM="Togula jolla, Strain CCCM 725" /LENGTH=278 /DNA_ID=CAMNT_0010931481 /DNA_START=89 /DNA_END=925 /DNA_ORIENTATION=+
MTSSAARPCQGAFSMRDVQKFQQLDARFFQTKICSFYVAGTCKRGTRCTYAHSEEHLTAPPNLKGSRVCRAYGTKNGCKKGNACMFFHADAPVSPHADAPLSPRREAPSSETSSYSRPGVPKIAYLNKFPASCESTRTSFFQHGKDATGSDNQARGPFSRQTTSDSSRGYLSVLSSWSYPRFEDAEQDLSSPSASRRTLSWAEMSEDIGVNGAPPLHSLGLTSTSQVPASVGMLPRVGSDSWSSWSSDTVAGWRSANRNCARISWADMCDESFDEDSP